MKRFTTTLFIAVLCAGAFPFTGSAQDAETMAMMMPGEQHKLLSRFAGNWDVDVKMWMPGMDVQTSKTTEHSKMIFDGRFVELHGSMDFMGMKMESIEYIGHNNVTKKFEFFRIESMGTGMVKTTGEYLKDEDAFFFKATDLMPQPGGEPQEVSYTLKWDFDGDNKYVFTLMWPDESGELFKMVETTATKKK